MLRTFLLWLFLFGCAEKHFPSSSEVGDVKTWDRFFFTKFLAPASGDEYLFSIDRTYFILVRKEKKDRLNID